MRLLDRYRDARRAEILATARTMIVERGYGAVTIRDLAAACEVSVPTLYNQFGGKDALLAEAIEGHFRASHATAAFAAASPGLERLLVIVDQSAVHLLEAPLYSQRLLTAFAALGGTTEVQRKVAESFLAALAVELVVMQTRRQLASWLAIPQLAGQIVSANIGTAVQWSAGALPDTALLPAMRYAMGLVVLAGARGSARGRIEALVTGAQGELGAAPSIPERRTRR